MSVPAPSGYRTFSSMPRTNNPYFSALHGPASNSFASLTSSFPPVSPRRTSPKKTPSPQRKARSSASVSLLSSFVRALKINKGKKHAPQSPLRAGGGGLHKMRSMPGAGRWEEYSPQRQYQRSIEERKRLRAAKQGAGMDVDSEFQLGDEEHDDDEDRNEDDCLSMGPPQYLTRRRRFSVGSDPFKTPPCTPTHAVPLSPVGTNGTAPSSPDSARSRRRRAVERSKMKSLQILGPEASAAVRERCEGWDV